MSILFFSSMVLARDAVKSWMSLLQFKMMSAT
jgi:hypothetical protein